MNLDTFFHNHAVIFAVDAVLLCAFAAFYGWTSRLNQFFFFGRTAPEGFSATPPARAIVRSYRLFVVANLLVALGIFAFLDGSRPRVPIAVAFLAAALYQLVLFNMTFARAHRATGIALLGYQPDPHAPLPASRVIAVPLLETAATAPLGIFAILLPAIVAGALWLLAMALTHLSSAALFAASEAAHADFALGLATGMLFATTASLLFLRFGSRQRTALGRFTNRTGLACSWIAVALFSTSVLATPAHLVFTSTISRAIFAVLVLLVVARILYTLVYAGKFAPPAQEHANDQNWHWGLYYYNRADPALFIQHRATAGYTLNFANIFSWPIAAAIYGNLAFLIYLQLR
jgi:hypothetical protein